MSPTEQEAVDRAARRLLEMEDAEIARGRKPGDAQDAVTPDSIIAEVATSWRHAASLLQVVCDRANEIRGGPAERGPRDTRQRAEWRKRKREQRAREAQNESEAA